MKVFYVYSVLDDVTIFVHEVTEEKVIYRVDENWTHGVEYGEWLERTPTNTPRDGSYRSIINKKDDSVFTSELDAIKYAIEQCWAEKSEIQEIMESLDNNLLELKRYKALLEYAERKPTGAKVSMRDI